MTVPSTAPGAERPRIRRWPPCTIRVGGRAEREAKSARYECGSSPIVRFGRPVDIEFVQWDRDGCDFRRYDDAPERNSIRLVAQIEMAVGMRPRKAIAAGGQLVCQWQETVLAAGRQDHARPEGLQTAGGIGCGCIFQSDRHEVDLAMGTKVLREQSLAARTRTIPNTAFMKFGILLEAEPAPSALFKNVGIVETNAVSRADVDETAEVLKTEEFVQQSVLAQAAEILIARQSGGTTQPAQHLPE